jgi:nitronate monooxygenase
MTLRTPLCDALGIELPIVQAPVTTSPALHAAVSNAGGLGTIQASWHEPDELRQAIRATKRLTDRPLAVNFVLEWPQAERLEIALEEGVRIVSLFWGDPAPYVAPIHAGGGIAIAAVGSAEEARRAVAAGIDVVVAQGQEAGGHVWGQVSTLALVPRVVDAVHPVPVIAAGGIADGRGLAAVLALGAAGAWIGTRFVASVEAGQHPEYKERLLTASESDTVYSTVFDVGWENAPLRTLRNSTVRRWEDAGRPPPGQRPGEGETLARAADGSPIVRYAVSDPDIATTGEIEALALYSGQGVGLIREILPAGAIVRSIAEEAEGTLRALGR